MSEPKDLLDRINVMLFHFDQRLGPRLLFHIAEIKDDRITASLTRLMDFNFLQEMKAFVNAMVNVVYSSMFFSVPNPLARGGKEEFMLSVVIFDPTITEYLMISSTEDEMEKSITKLKESPELLNVVNFTSPTLEEFPFLATTLRDLRDKVTTLLQMIFYGQFEGEEDPISQVLDKIGKEVGKRIIQTININSAKKPRDKITDILKSPIVARWGKFSLMHFDPEEKVASIAVRNSIWTDSLGVIATKTCSFIEGMLETIFSRIFEDKIFCEETRCASEYSYIQECLFQISREGAGREQAVHASTQAIREMGLKEREKTIELINQEIGRDIYYELDPMIRLIQLFNKCSFINDFYFDEEKFLLVCGFWKHPDNIMCNDCEKWITETCKTDISLEKTEHRICEITLKNDDEEGD
ncbi:MAG: hypothetical protein K9W46_11855 [Candidatus Heimdallarchaeum endolithica]|uniref:Uncharacterized protein n=1 Tax=Candidatus Heimdallarchaeum endolithica TaxID=2876572 RepID=A0A9Y1BQK0_9ARCH|nr:MAG: hypothetical protein K9W46_11855 [Candidatus Heimdallarchaeum endolithica]